MVTLISDNHANEFLGQWKTYTPQGENDLLINLGDSCFHFADRPEYLEFDRWFLSRPYDVALVDGNHEDFAYLNSLPEETWHGGRVNRINEHTVHLKRGEFYEIEGKTYFVFGGCNSGAKWKKLGLWHPGDVPTHEEVAYAYENLRRHGNRVDYILSHKYFCDQCFVQPGEAEYEIFLLNRYIDTHVTFTRWYSGHRHEKRDIDAKHTVIFDELVEVNN